MTTLPHPLSYLRPSIKLVSPHGLAIHFTVNTDACQIPLVLPCPQYSLNIVFVSFMCRQAAVARLEARLADEPGETLSILYCKSVNRQVSSFMWCVYKAAFTRTNPGYLTGLESGLEVSTHATF